MPQLDFQRDVIERSDGVPVVVDFWAPWCAPCRTLGPVIEELAASADGRWELVKVDTDQHPDLAQAWNVMGIPAVKMFQGGRAIAEFTGALPREEIVRWLDAHLPDRRRERLEEIARETFEAAGGALDETIRRLEAFVEEHPDIPAGRLKLARALVTIDPARARALVEDTGAGADGAEEAADVRALADLMEAAGDPPPALAASLDAARGALREGDADRALENLVDATIRDREYGGQLSRRAAIALFHRLGRDHEVTRRHERRLAMALHS